MPLSTKETVRVLIEALRQSRLSSILELEDIAVQAKTSESLAGTVLTRFIADDRKGQLSLDSKSRVQIALEVARAGRLNDAARALSWQEFESFGAECLAEAGFRVEKNVRVQGAGRAWQIDLVGYRGDLVLTIDCKHWNTSGYESRLAPPAAHQRAATSHLLRTLTKKTGDRGKVLQGLGVILTLLEPPARFLEKAALVSVGQLPGFLSSVTPYDTSLPLLSTPDVLVENPMS